MARVTEVEPSGMPDTMAPRIHLSESRIADLKTLLDLEPELLGRVVQVIARLDPPPPTPDEIQMAIGEVIRESPATGDSVARVALWLESLRIGVQGLNSPSDEVLETFDGFVEEIVGETAYVRLVSREHGDVLHGEYPASKLASQGIEEQSRFLCTTVKAGESTRVVLRPIPDVPVTDEELRAIEALIDEALPLDDAIEY